MLEILHMKKGHIVFLFSGILQFSASIWLWCRVLVPVAVQGHIDMSLCMYNCYRLEYVRTITDHQSTVRHVCVSHTSGDIVSVSYAPENQGGDIMSLVTNVADHGTII